MLISLPQDESTILLMDLHLTKILAVGKPNFIEVKRIINIARTALRVFLGGQAASGLGRAVGEMMMFCWKTASNVSVWVSPRCREREREREDQNTFFVVSQLRPQPSLATRGAGGETSSNVSILRASLLQAVKVQTSAGNGISARRWDGWSKGAIFYKFWKSFFSFWAPTPG